MVKQLNPPDATIRIKQPGDDDDGVWDGASDSTGQGIDGSWNGGHLLSGSSASDSPGTPTSHHRSSSLVTDSLAANLAAARVRAEERRLAAQQEWPKEEERWATMEQNQLQEEVRLWEEGRLLEEQRLAAKERLVCLLEKERKAAEVAAQQAERERHVKEEAQRLHKEQRLLEEARLLEEEHLVEEEERMRKRNRERSVSEERERLHEEERQVAEAMALAEIDRLEAQQRLEAGLAELERLAEEASAKMEEARLAAEMATNAEYTRLMADMAAKAEEERLSARVSRAEEERLAAEAAVAEQEHLEARLTRAFAKSTAKPLEIMAIQLTASAIAQAEADVKEVTEKESQADTKCEAALEECLALAPMLAVPERPCGKVDDGLEVEAHGGCYCAIL